MIEERLNEKIETSWLARRPVWLSILCGLSLLFHLPVFVLVLYGFVRGVAPITWIELILLFTYYVPATVATWLLWNLKRLGAYAWWFSLLAAAVGGTLSAPGERLNLAQLLVPGFFSLDAIGLHAQRKLD